MQKVRKPRQTALAMRSTTERAIETSTVGAGRGPIRRQADRSFERLEENAGSISKEKLPVPDVA